MADNSKALQTSGAGLPIDSGLNKMQLGALGQIDLTGLTEEDVRQLKVKHAEGMIALSQRGSELNIDVGATQANLNNLAENVNQLSADGNAVTITNIQKNSLGHTEVIMGNTETAMKGKISRAQRGEPDRLLWFLIFGAVVIVAIAMMFKR